MANLSNDGRTARDYAGPVEEWRVQADPSPGFPAYDFVWSGPSAEAKARAFMAQFGVRSSLENVRISNRTVTFGSWETALDTVAE